MYFLLNFKGTEAQAIFALLGTSGDYRSEAAGWYYPVIFVLIFNGIFRQYDRLVILTNMSSEYTFQIFVGILKHL